MALRFFDGFDFYGSSDMTIGRYTSVSNQSMSSTTRFGSGQSLRFTGVGFARKTIDAQGTWIIGVAAQLPLVGAAGGTTPDNILVLFNGSTRVAGLFLNYDGILSVIAYDNGAAAHTMCTGVKQIGPNQWYYIEWKFAGGATVNVVNTTVRINGVQDSTFAATSGGSTSASATMDLIRLNGPLNATYLYDDFYACDGTGGIHDTFLGDVRVGTLRPDGAGNSTQWTPSSSTNFSRVNETLYDGDTTYVSTSGVNDIDSYTLGNIPTTPTSILGVQATAIGKNVTTSHTFQITTYISATTYTSSTFTLTGSYAFYTQLQELSPATAAAWDGTEINGMEMGLKLIT